MATATPRKRPTRHRQTSLTLQVPRSPLDHPVHGKDIRLLGLKVVGEGYSEIIDSDGRSQIQFYVELDQATARRIIAKFNDSNRIRTDGHVEYLVMCQEAGQFMLNGVPMIFSWNVQLVDGSHRIFMVVVSGKSQIIPVVMGVDPECFKTYDINVRRTLKHAMQVKGLTDESTRQATVNKLFEYEMGTLLLRHNDTPGAHLGLRFAKKHKLLLDEAMWFAGAFVKTNDPLALQKFSASWVAFAYVVLAAIDKPAAALYLHQLITGVDIKARGPAMSVRKHWTKVINEKRGRYPEEHELYALLFWGWNKFCEQKSNIKNIRMTTNGKWDDGCPRYAIPDLLKPTKEAKAKIDRWFFGNPKTNEPGFEQESYTPALLRVKDRSETRSMNAQLRARDEDGVRAATLRARTKLKIAQAAEAIQAAGLGDLL